MEITNRIGQRALTYVAAVTSQGYELTSEEFERYIGMPMPAVDLDLAVAGSEGGADGAEPVLDWLVRLGWLSRASGTVAITPLGLAVLRAVEQHELATELPPEVVLGPAEPLTYGPVLGRLGDLGDALLVDRTFQFDQLLDVMLRTSVTRILVGADAQYEQDRRRLAAALSRPLGLDRHLRAAVSAELHDRFAVPASGPVAFLAATRNVLGHRHAIIGLVQAPAADDIRRQLEDLWSRATPLTAAPQAVAAVPAGEPAAADPGGPDARDPDTVPHQAPAPAVSASPAAQAPVQPLPELPPLGPGPGADLDQAPAADPWDLPRPASPAAQPPSPVTALRSLVSPLEGAALSGSQRQAGDRDEDPTRPAPPLPPAPLLRPVPGGRPLNEPVLRPVGDPPRFPEPPRLGEPPFGAQGQPGRFGDLGQHPSGGRQGPAQGPGQSGPEGGEPRPAPPWSPPNPWTPPTSRGPSPFQRHDRPPAEPDDDGPATQAWSADDRDA